MYANWLTNDFSADIATDTWHNFNALQGSAGADVIQIGNWGY